MASIQKRINKDGEVSFLVTVFLGFDESGNKLRHHETVYGSKNDAKIRAGKLEEARSQGRIVSGRTTIGTLFDELLRNYKLNGQDSDGTEAGRIRKSLRPFFGNMDANKLVDAHVSAYVDKRKSARAANGTINRELSLLRLALDLGIKSTPRRVAQAPNIHTLVESNARTGFLEPEDYRSLRDALPAYLKPLLTLGYWSGMRKGEMFGLRWEQVDLRERVIRLNPGETKNKDGRILPLFGDLLETIRMQRAIRDAEYPTCEWVFHYQGKQLGKNIRRQWERACKKVGLWDPTKIRGKQIGGPTKLIHDLRRTGVRNLVRAGVPEKVAMLISGHKTRSVFDRYNVCDDRDVRDAMYRLSLYHEANEQIPTEFQQKPESGLPQ